MSEALEALPPLYRLRIALMCLPPLQTAGARGHWARRHRIAKKWKDAVGWAAKAKGLPSAPLERADIEFIRYGIREPDFDGLVTSFKPLLDGMKGLVIVDDSPRHVSALYRFEPVRRLMEQRVLLIVTERQP